MTDLMLYNTLTRRKDLFIPIDPENVRMYVCGPTVYDRPHIGNARSVVIYDVLYRVLMQRYGAANVTYIRNITDVDDKINAAAKSNGEPISTLTKRITGWFHEDIGALAVLPATHSLTGKENPQQALLDAKGIMGEPRATDHIPHMITMIESLIASGHAYEAQGHVLFAVQTDAHYGSLSGRKLEDMIAGARIDVEAYKKHPGDFVLWKPADTSDDASSVFDSPWGKGRPGWHIECSAMSTTYLGSQFDIHGGGADLMFPHHENECAQSRCALDNASFANVWVHNGFLTVNGEKMSKSLGNFITVKELLDKGIKGEVIRLALLMTKYNEPLNWNDKLVYDAQHMLDKWYRSLPQKAPSSPPAGEFLDALYDDLNIPKALSIMHTASPDEWITMGHLLGLFNHSPDQWFKGDSDSDDHKAIETLVNQRIEAKKAKNWAGADAIRKTLADKGVILEDRPDGTTYWRLT